MAVPAFFMDAKAEQLIEPTSGKLNPLELRPTAVHNIMQQM
jgi:hypothetical protein